MIYVTETDTEYLVSIPITEKERAKGIQGRKWDPKRAVWVYPKTRAVLDELLAEFGDANSKIQVVIPGNEQKLQPRATAQETEKNELQRQLDEIKKTLNQISSIPATNDTEKGKLVLQLATMDQQLQTMKSQLENKDQIIAELKIKTESSEEQVTQLRELLASKDKAQQNCAISIKERAKEATSNDPKFCRLIDNREVDKDLLNDITNNMIFELKKLLNVNDPNMSLYDLILQAAESNILEPEAIDYAHLIRKERNKVIHANPYVKTLDARYMMCLFAAALLWPYFPEK